MQEDPQEPIEINPNIPVAINKIIMKALQKDVTLRYQSATEMLVDLRKSLKDPSGDFVEEYEYDKTARTQKINTDMYANLGTRTNKRNQQEKEEGKFKQFIKKHKTLSIIIGLILLFSISLGGTLLVLNITNPAEVPMPNVVGLSKEEAQKAIEVAKLKFEVSKEEFNKDVPEGYIVSQDPIYMEKYNQVKEGSTVSVVVSKGQEKTTVPKVEGKEKAEAIQLIEAAKLKAEVIEENSKTVKEGFVISQETEGNAEAFAGDTVKIHVSTGIKQITVTSVIGKTQDEAKKTLEDLGLVVTVVTEEDSSKEKGVVLKQSINGGESAEEGAKITITVNSFEASKSMTITMDVKTITGGYQEENKNGNDTSNEASSSTSVAKTVSITIKSGNTTLWSDSGVDKNITNKTATITGKGSMDLTISITDNSGGNWTRSLSVNFNTETSKTVK